MATTVFEDLTAKADAWCREFERYKDECKVFAEKLRVELIEYLGAKSTDIEFYVLDEHLDRVRDAGSTLSPRLQVGDDGFVYFGLTLFLKRWWPRLRRSSQLLFTGDGGRWGLFPSSAMTI
jgi:hypothetical protein